VYLYHFACINPITKQGIDQQELCLAPNPNLFSTNEESIISIICVKLRQDAAKLAIHHI
jgi:hypothetical protein